MKLQISQLKDGENEFAYSSTKEPWFQELLKKVKRMDFGFNETENASLELRLTKIDPDYYLKGVLNAKTRQICSRCAETFQSSLTHPFELALAHVPHGKAGSPQIAEESEELDVIYFEGNEIDLSPLVEEQLFLSEPYQSHCRPDCRGLCQQCGKNLNAGPCACKADRRSSPFSILNDLKL